MRHAAEQSSHPLAGATGARIPVRILTRGCRPGPNQRPGGLRDSVTRSMRRSEVHGTRHNGDQIEAASPPRRSLPEPIPRRTPLGDTSLSPPSTQPTPLHTTSVTVLARASTHLPRHLLSPAWHSPARRYKFIYNSLAAPTPAPAPCRLAPSGYHSRSFTSLLGT